MDKYLKNEIKNNRINYILMIIAILLSIVSLFLGVGNSIKIGNIEHMRDSFNTYNGSTINNQGMSAEDVDYITSKAVNDSVDWMYEYEEVINAVKNDKNLHFALIWAGSQEEYEQLDESKKLPYVEYQIYDAESNTFTIISPNN